MPRWKSFEKEKPGHGDPVFFRSAQGCPIVRMGIASRPSVLEPHKFHSDYWVLVSRGCVCLLSDMIEPDKRGSVVKYEDIREFEFTMLSVWIGFNELFD